MERLKFDEVENSLLSFRIGRRLILDRFLECIANNPEIQEPAIFLSRLFVRLKSADSIIEKIKRKKLPVHSPDDIPASIDDILGFRLIAENQAERRFLENFLSQTFQVNSRVDSAHIQQYGGQSIDYLLTYEYEGQSYPFAVQLRTFLQHYWAGQSFFLFHKSYPDVALPYQNDLLALSSALRSAEESVERIRAGRKETWTTAIGLAQWQSWPIRTQIHLMVIQPHERFVEQQKIHLTGNDDTDHGVIVQAKVKFYAKYPDAAVVECNCSNFASYLLNEPQVHVGSEYYDKVIW